MRKENKMPKKVNIICTNCPMGCEISLTIDEKTDKVLNIEGNKCKQGKQYALTEYKNPVRVLTATVRTNSVENPLLPVRTDNPVPRDKMKDMMYEIAKIKVKKPVQLGQIIEKNIMSMGVNLIATEDLDQW
jgi:CxxC motif-containing protein